MGNCLRGWLGLGLVAGLVIAAGMGAVHAVTDGRADELAALATSCRKSNLTNGRSPDGSASSGLIITCDTLEGDPRLEGQMMLWELCAERCTGTFRIDSDTGLLWQGSYTVTESSGLVVRHVEGQANEYGTVTQMVAALQFVGPGAIQIVGEARQLGEADDR